MVFGWSHSSTVGLHLGLEKVGVDSGAQVYLCLASGGSHNSGQVLFLRDLNQVGVYDGPPSSILFFYGVVMGQDVAIDRKEASEGRAGEVQPLLIRVVQVMNYRHLRREKQKRTFLSI